MNLIKPYLLNVGEKIKIFLFQLMLMMAMLVVIYMLKVLNMMFLKIDILFIQDCILLQKKLKFNAILIFHIY